jgi:hypothetical protein
MSKKSKGKSNVFWIVMSFIVFWSSAMILHHNIGENNYSLGLFVAPFAYVGVLIVVAKLKEHNLWF